MKMPSASLIFNVLAPIAIGFVVVAAIEQGHQTAASAAPDPEQVAQVAASAPAPDPEAIANWKGKPLSDQIFAGDWQLVATSADDAREYYVDHTHVAALGPRFARVKFVDVKPKLYGTEYKRETSIDQEMFDCDSGSYFIVGTASFDQGGKQIKYYSETVSSMTKAGRKMQIPAPNSMGEAGVKYVCSL